MTNSFLRVTFPKTDNLMFNNPSTWRCLEFKNCDFWQPAHSVSWVNLSTSHFAMFFESKRCQADGKFVFTSPQGLTSSIKTFMNPQSIQSMMIGENHNYSHHPVSTTQRCPAHYERADIDDFNDLTIDNGGLSSNWNDITPDDAEIAFI